MKSALSLFLCIIWVFYGPGEARGQVINTCAGIGTEGYSGDGMAATTAQLDSPTCLASDAAGNIYFCDQKNSCVRRIDTAGIITTIAGTGHPGWSGDNGPAVLAKLSANWGVAIGPDGSIYISDQGNVRIRRIDAAGIITTYAGSGASGTGGDNGPATAAAFIRPIGIAADAAGNVYVGDQDARTIRKIDPAGTITLLAGTTGGYGSSGDGGPATNALLSATYGLSADAAGNVYIADAENNRIRMVNTSGIITTVAGNGYAGSAGDSGPAVNANLNHPTCAYKDAAGNLLIADHTNNRIRKVDAGGIISTLAGTGSPAFGGDGGSCTVADLFHPTTVTANARGIYLADLRNVRIRKISKSIFFPGGHTARITVCENAPPSGLDSVLTLHDAAAGLTDNWALLPSSGPAHGTVYVTYSAVATGADARPSGTFYSAMPGYYGNDTFKVVASNGIMADTITIFVTIVELITSAGTITGDSVVCARSILALADTVAGGAWTVSNLHAIVTGTTGMVTGQSPGRDTITYTVGNSCGSAKTTKVIIVKPLPDAGTITGPTQLCVGLAIALTDTTEGGVWHASNGNGAVSPVPDSCYITGLHIGTDTITYTLTDSFCSASASHIMTIEARPTTNITGGLDQLCAGKTMNLAGIPPGGTWAIINSNALFSLTATGIMVTGETPGMDTLNYTIVNFCGTSSASWPFIVDSLPAKPVVSRNESTLYSTRGYTSYQWTLEGGVITGATADSVELLNIGHYAVTVSDINGCSISSDPVDFEGCGLAELILFPNPTETTIYINWCQRVTVRILSMDGRQIKTIYNTNQVDLGNLPDEDYMLALYDRNGKKIITKKVVKRSK